MAGAGYKLFNTGDVLTAAQVNTYLNEQTVMVFASSAARTSALSGVLAEGMVSYLQDTNAVEVYNGTAWVGVSGAGDVTEVQAGTGISVASGTGPIPVVTNTMATAIDAAGDLVYGTGADTFSKLAIGTANQVLTVNSGATAPEWKTPTTGSTFAGCGLTKSATQAVATATTVFLTFDTEEFDSDAYHSTSSNTSRITIPSGKGGKYLFVATANFEGNGTGQRLLMLYKNGSVHKYSLSLPGLSGASWRATTSIIVSAVATDYFEFAVYQDSGVSLNINGGATDTTFSTTYLGA